MFAACPAPGSEQQLATCLPKMHPDSPSPPNPVDAAPDPLLSPRTFCCTPPLPFSLGASPLARTSSYSCLPPHRIHSAAARHFRPSRYSARPGRGTQSSWEQPLLPVPGVLHSNPRLQGLPERPRLWVSVPTARPAWRAPPALSTRQAAVHTGASARRPPLPGSPRQADCVPTLC